jgi:hypothetical protein
LATVLLASEVELRRSEVLHLGEGDAELVVRPRCLPELRRRGVDDSGELPGAGAGPDMPPAGGGDVAGPTCGFGRAGKKTVNDCWLTPTTNVRTEALV